MKIFQKSIPLSIKPVAFNEIYLSSKIYLKFCKMRKILRYIHTIMSNKDCLDDFLVKSSQELKQISPELAHTMQ